MTNDFGYQFIPPPPPLADFVEAIGMFYNRSSEPRDIVVVPDGRVDLFFSRSASEPYHVMLMGLETAPKQRSVPAGTLTFSVSFKPLGVEYMLCTAIADILNVGRILPNNFWGFGASDLDDFEKFEIKATHKLLSLVPAQPDQRKQKLFDLIYSCNGEISVKEISERLFWSSRQINRYFTAQFGIPLKSFCKILRFRESLKHIANGRLFPELNFADQNHFIREIKAFSGVVPKELLKNTNDRFVLLSVLKQG